MASDRIKEIQDFDKSAEMRKIREDNRLARIKIWLGNYTGDKELEAEGKREKAINRQDEIDVTARAGLGFLGNHFKNKGL